MNVSLPGDAKRLTDAISAIQEGTKKIVGYQGQHSLADGRFGFERLHNLCPDVDDPEHH
jgi:hypothetical protein